jgi:hypothetical protein
MEFNMFSIFKKNPTKKLNRLYLAKLEKAMHAQRNGDIESYSIIATEAEQIRIQIQELDNSTET